MSLRRVQEVDRVPPAYPGKRLYLAHIAASDTVSCRVSVRRRVGSANGSILAVSELHSLHISFNSTIKYVNMKSWTFDKTLTIFIQRLQWFFLYSYKWKLFHVKKVKKQQVKRRRFLFCSGACLLEPAFNIWNEICGTKSDGEVGSDFDISDGNVRERRRKKENERFEFMGKEQKNEIKIRWELKIKYNLKQI